MAIKHDRKMKGVKNYTTVFKITFKVTATTF